MTRRFSIIQLALFGQIIVEAPALAAGGAHVVDDAAVETPGTCHAENWLTAASSRSGVANISPACTRIAWPNLELGGAYAHAWADGRGGSLISLTPKLVLRSEDTGVGVGVAGSVSYGLGRSRLEAASLTVPVTVAASERIRLNFNIGWQWFRMTDSHDLFVGAQAEIGLNDKLNLMIEAFTRDKGNAGGQLGLRWTPGKGNVDIDLLLGRYLDGATRNAITLGITLRR